MVGAVGWMLGHAAGLGQDRSGTWLLPVKSTL